MLRPTGQLSPAAGVARFSIWQNLEERWKADWSHRIVELDRIRQFQQHDVTGTASSRRRQGVVVFLVKDDFTDWHPNGERIWL